MTPPLTRETLTEIRRLRDAMPSSLPRLTAVKDGGLYKIVGLADRTLHIASDVIPTDAKLIARLLNNLDSLLAAAERGLDVEGGR